MRIRSLQLSLMVALAAALAASPADAQGKGKGHDKNRERTEQVRFREDDRRRDDRWDDDDVRLERRRQVPPGWCRGKGNPHNTPENCGYSRDRRRYEDRRYDDRRYEDRRYEDRRYDDRYGRLGSSGSYQEAHQAFHREHDRICRERASQRAFDPVWQLRVRNECKVEHDRWHASTGTRH